MFPPTLTICQAQRSKGTPSSQGDPYPTGKMGILGSPLYREDGGEGPHSHGRTGTREPHSTVTMGTRGPQSKGSPKCCDTGPTWAWLIGASLTEPHMGSKSVPRELSIYV